MPDIVSQRQTYILVADDTALYPAEWLYPADDLYPRDAGLSAVTNIVAGSLKLDEKIAEKIPQFGQLYASKFECKIYLTGDLQGKSIQVYQMDDGVYRAVFTGIIDSCKLDKVGTDRTIVAYDYAYTKGKINVAPWWEEFWQTRETSTLKAARDSMLSWAGIAYENVVLPNDDMEIVKTVDLTSCTLTAMLKMMCEVSYCFPHFDRIGFLQFIFLNTEPEETVDLTDRYEWSKSSFENFSTSEIDGVQFYDSGNQLKWTVGETNNAYPVRKNIFLYEKGTTALNQLGSAMLEYLEDLTYTPAKVKMIASDWDLRLGDYVHTENGDFYITHNMYSGSQLFEQTIEAQGQEFLYSGTPHIDYGEVVLNEKIARVNFTIEQFQIEYADFKDQTSANFTITSQAISSEVTRATTSEGTIAQNLANEILRSTGVEQTITTNLGNEVTRATTAEQSLSSRITQTAEAITSEVTRATHVEDTITNNLSGEVTRATTAESNLSSRITQTAESISSEVTRATNVETTITNNLDGEVSRATNAEGALSTRITTETTNLSSRITQTAEAITSEVTRATEVEESMFANYIGTVVPTTSNAPASSWNTAAKKAAHVGETYYNKTTKKYYRWTATKSGSTVTYNWQAIDTSTARSYSVVSSTIKQTADSLTSEITAETSRASGEESSLSTRITQTADSITSEVTRATTAETTLTTNLANEVNRATTAESNLATQIQTTSQTLSSSISQNASAITAEVTRATESEESMFANYVGTVAPTTSNTPASSWNTNAKKAQHVGEIYYDKVAKKYYRWTVSDSTYSWSQIDLTNKRTYDMVSSQLKITADAITSEVTRASNAESSLSSQIQQTAQSISLDVTNGTTSSTIKLKLGTTELSSKTIQMTGLVTFTDLSTSGSTTINGSNITTGTIDASVVSVTNLNASNITTGDLSADRIKGGQLTISAATGYTEAIKVQYSGNDYIVISPNSGIVVGYSYGNYKTSITGNGIAVGSGSYNNAIVIKGDFNSGGITVGPNSNDQTVINNGQIKIKNSSWSGGSVSIENSYSGPCLVIKATSDSYNAIEVTTGIAQLKALKCDSLQVKQSSYSSSYYTYSDTSVKYLDAGNATVGVTEIKKWRIKDDLSLWAVQGSSAPNMHSDGNGGYSFSSSPTWKKIDIEEHDSYSTKLYAISVSGYASSISFQTKNVLGR